MKISKFISRKLVVGAMALVMLFGLFFTAIPSASADTSRDVIVGMTDKGWYISNAAAARFTRTPVSDAQAALDKGVKDLANRKQPAAFALIDPAVVPSNCGGSIDQCAETLRNQINKYNIVVLVDTGDNIGLSAKGLSTSEVQQLKTAARNTFTTNGPAGGSVFLANSAADKIEANAKATQDASTGSTIFTIVAVVVFLLIIGGLVWFLFNRTKKNWQTELQALNEESAKINDYIYRLSGDVDYAFGESGERIKTKFSEATLGMETVNADLRQLASAEPSRLATGWSQWRDKRDETKAKLESIRTNLAQVEREIQSSKQLPGS